LEGTGASVAGVELEVVISADLPEHIKTSLRKIVSLHS